MSPGVGSPRRKPFSSWKESVDVKKQRPAEGWHLHLRAARAACLTFDQGVLVCGGGARQHSQLWPDLVDSLLLNLERDVGEGGLVRLGEKQARRKEGTGLESLGSWHTGWLLYNHAAPVPPGPPAKLIPPGHVPLPSHCGSSD